MLEGTFLKEDGRSRFFRVSSGGRLEYWASAADVEESPARGAYDLRDLSAVSTAAAPPEGPTVPADSRPGAKVRSPVPPLDPRGAGEVSAGDLKTRLVLTFRKGQRSRWLTAPCRGRGNAERLAETVCR